MVADLTDSTAVGAPLDGVMFGGAPAPDLLAKKARQAFPTASVCAFLQLYIHGLVVHYFPGAKVMDSRKPAASPLDLVIASCLIARDV